MYTCSIHVNAHVHLGPSVYIYEKTMLKDVESRQPVGPCLIGDSVTAYLQPIYLPVHVIATLSHVRARACICQCIIAGLRTGRLGIKRKTLRPLSFSLFFLSPLRNRSSFFLSLATRWRYAMEMCYGSLPNYYS